MEKESMVIDMFQFQNKEFSQLTKRLKLDIIWENKFIDTKEESQEYIILLRIVCRQPFL